MPVVTPPVGAVTLSLPAMAQPAARAELASDAFTALGIEIVAPNPVVTLAGRAAVGGAASRGGAMRLELVQPAAPTRWRIVGGTHVERSIDAGVTWDLLPIDPALTTPILAGAAASQSVCWLVGSGGVVLVTTDGRTFRRASLSEPIRLVGVVAEDGLRATVLAADGRKFSTVDGGVTWK